MNRYWVPASTWLCLLWLIGMSSSSGCSKTSSVKNDAEKAVRIGVSFETLQTEFWVAGLDAIKAECQKRGYEAIVSVADRDSNRQLQQVKNFITKGVDGIILVPKDANSGGPMIRAANKAGIPIALFNRGAEATDLKFVAVVANNQLLAEKTTEYLLKKAKERSTPVKAIVLLGDLGDTNAIARRDGFLAAVAKYTGEIEVVSQIPTEWNQEKSQAGLVNALQAHPDANLIFTSSDFLLPSIVSALKGAGLYHPAGHEKHVILGGFDGDATAYRMMQEGFLDATGVQDVYFEAAQCVKAIEDLRRGIEVPQQIDDPGFVIHRENMAELAGQMWGAQVQGSK